MGFGKFRRGRQRRLEVRQRFDRPIKAAQRVTAIGQDLRMTGQACERGVVARHRLDRLVQSQKRIAPVDESADVTRRDRQHMIVVRQRVVGMIEREIRVAEIVENFRMVRRQIQRMAIARDGFVVTSGRMQRQPEIRQRIGGTGIDLERPRQEAERIDQAMALEVEHSEQVQRIEIIGPVRQNSGAQSFRPVEFALLKGIDKPAAASETGSASLAMSFSSSPTTGSLSRILAFESINARRLAFSALCLNRN